MKMYHTNAISTQSGPTKVVHFLNHLHFTPCSMNLHGFDIMIAMQYALTCMIIIQKGFSHKVIAQDVYSFLFLNENQKGKETQIESLKLKLSGTKCRGFKSHVVTRKFRAYHF